MRNGNPPSIDGAGSSRAQIQAQTPGAASPRFAVVAASLRRGAGFACPEGDGSPGFTRRRSGAATTRCETATRLSFDGARSSPKNPGTNPGAASPRSAVVAASLRRGAGIARPERDGSPGFTRRRSGAATTSCETATRLSFDGARSSRAQKSKHKPRGRLRLDGTTGFTRRRSGAAPTAAPTAVYPSSATTPMRRNFS